MPLVSVLMPTYNASKFLHEAIDSILNQSFSDFEFIIVDDASSDNSIEIIESYDDRRIRLIKRKENGGIVDALNDGLDQINTKYIARMDADDISLPERLRIQIDYLEQNTNVGICGCWIELFGNEQGIWKFPISHNEIVSGFIFNSCIAHPTVVIRSSVLKENKLAYSKRFPHMEDFYLWYQLKNKTQFHNINKVLLRYRRLEDSITQINSKTYYLRKKELNMFLIHDLGILLQNEEIKYHALPLKNSIIPTPTNIVQYKKWYNKLIIYNNIHKIYPKKEFCKVVEQRWAKLFYSLPHYSWRSVFIYWLISKKITSMQVRYFIGIIYNGIKAKILIRIL